MNWMKQDRKRKQGGFSLIELLIVVTIILIIAAIAIPKLLTVKQQANATAAVANMRTLGNGLNAYASQYPAVGYPAALTNLAAPSGGSGSTPTSTAANLIDDQLANSGTTPKQGYIFAYTPGTASNGPVTTYQIMASPQSGAGTRYFCTDESGVIRYADGAACDWTTSPIIGG